MHPHREEIILQFYYILTSYDSSTLTTAITINDEEDEDAEAFVITKKRKVAPEH